MAIATFQLAPQSGGPLDGAMAAAKGPVGIIAGFGRKLNAAARKPLLPRADSTPPMPPRNAKRQAR